MTPIEQLQLELDAERHRHQETALALRRLLEEGFSETKPGRYELEAEVFDVDLQSMEVGTAVCLDPLNALIEEGWRALAVADAEEGEA